MKSFLDISPGRLWRAAGFIAILLSASTQAQSACPNWVETASGSVFNVSALIADTGSPESALEKVRTALSKVDAGGGCAAFGNTRACDETVTLARKAIGALEACTASATSKAPRR